MKKLGFTLAEVLITLAIIGVVAALTLPNLTADTAAAKIGPRLGKAVSTLEQASESLLNAHSIDSILDEYGDTDSTSYSNELTNYMKAIYDGGYLRGNDGVDYYINFPGLAPSLSDPPHKQRLGQVTIDINGTNVPPNKDAVDVFYFSIRGDGSLVPKGQKGWNGSDTDDWTTKCPVNASPTDPSYCAGHIFANNMKVLYR